jgi:ArsR family transcriptional regulator, arsenate/arsenite/antimonite-responsive transcriptional repressor
LRTPIWRRRDPADARPRSRQAASASCSFASELDGCQYVSKSSLPLSDVSACAFAPLVREPLSVEAAAEMAVKLKALADPVRLRLFSSVASDAGGEACVCDISGGFEVSQPTISHHLKVLRDAGLLTSQRRASWVYYAVVPEALRDLSSLLNVDADTVIGASA